MPSSSRSALTSSFPIEILVLKWTSPTREEASSLRALITDLLRGAAKVTSPEFPGWRVVWKLHASHPTGTTTRLLVHVEPESDLPF